MECESMLFIKILRSITILSLRPFNFFFSNSLIDFYSYEVVSLSGMGKNEA